jgi:hypothetical protein
VSSVDVGPILVGHSRTAAVLEGLFTLDLGAVGPYWWTATPGIAVQSKCLGTGGWCEFGITVTPDSVGPFSGQVTVYQCVTVQCLQPGELDIAVTATGVSSVTSAAAPYWRGWDIARGVALMPSSDSGYVLDGFGALHPFSLANTQKPPLTHGAPYWPGWAIARGVALLPDGTGGYVVDGFGGLHPFGVGTSSAPPPARGGAYWLGRDIVRGVAINGQGTGGYTLDAFGGMHPFAVGNNLRPDVPPPNAAPYFPGIDWARGIASDPMEPDAGYLLDSFGSTHPFGSGVICSVPPTLVGGPSWSFDIARGMALDPLPFRAVIVDGYGGLHWTR